MGCNCKNKNIDIAIESENKSIIYNILFYSVKVIGFLIALTLMPILIIMISIFMFKVIVLSGNVDIKPLFSKILNLIKPNDEDEEYEDENDDNLTEDDYVVIDVDDLETKNN